MRRRLVYWRRSGDIVSPFVCVIAFVLVTNVVFILRWTQTSPHSTDDASPTDASFPSWHSGTTDSYRRRLRFPLQSAFIHAPTAHETVELGLPTNFSGILARAFEPAILPCFPAEHRWYGQHVLTSKTSTGILFNKPFKTGSSTAVGVHLRIARNLAKKKLFSHRDSLNSSTVSEDSDYSICQTRFDHGLARDIFPHRDTQQSFLWTVLRHPTQRATSMFFHFMVARHKVEPTDFNFQAAIEHGAVMVRDYYLYILSTTGYASRQLNDPLHTAQSILNEYNFVAITERYDESLVALQLLLGLSTADILYLSAKHHGNFDDGAGKKRCFYIWPPFLTPGMQSYFASDHWHDMIQWDLALYQAANRSLDLTIERLGKGLFDGMLQRFKAAKAAAHSSCLGEAIFPCSDGGEWRPNNETNCIWNDSGCGNHCLDKLSDELGLWDSTALIQ